MKKVILYPLNDNEKKGLPADIDLLEQAIQNLKTKPTDKRRHCHLGHVLIRVLEQIKLKLRNVEVNIVDEPTHVYSDLNELNQSIQKLKENPTDVDLIYRVHNDILDVLDIFEIDFKH